MLVRSSRTVLALAFLACVSAVHAASPALETRSLAAIAARNLALPLPPQLKDDDFSRRSRVREVKLSPDGLRVAYLESDAGSASLKLLDTRTGERKLLLASAGRSDVHWTRDGGALFVDSGDALSVVSATDGASTRIAAFDQAKRQQFLAVDMSHPQHALVDQFDSAANSYRLERLGADGKRELLYEGPKLLDFLQGGDGQLSFIRTLDAQYNQVVARRQDGKWIEATRCKPLRACSLVAASPDGRLLDMIVNLDGDRKSLVQLDLRKNTQRVLHTDPSGLSDLKQVVLSARAQQPLFAVYGMPQRRNDGLTAPARQAAADIAKRFPDAAISVVPSEAGTRLLLAERGPRLVQERYWLYDAAKRTFEEILQAERALGEPLPEQQLAQKIALHYRASDGALVHGYLSLPPGRNTATLPMLTMVHGGPWAAVENDYSSLVQLLVNRGFAVFQPNFRASTGYGDKYMLAPRADFGNGRVQADIVDGVRWLVAHGIGDRNRLAIMGDSFGGYSTLLALTNTPDLFQFGMAMVPPPDFGRTLRAVADSGAQENGVPISVRLPAMGIALNDAEAMKPLSDAAPAAHAANVTRPLLIMAGAKDDKVSIAAVTDYVAKLQALNRPVSLLVGPDEGHNARKPVTRQAYLYLLQRMLHQYLGGPAAPAPSAELAAYLQQTMKANGALPM